MTEETVAWSDAKDAVRAAVGFHEKQKARKSVTMVGASEGSITFFLGAAVLALAPSDLVSQRGQQVARALPRAEQRVDRRREQGLEGGALLDLPRLHSARETDPKGF